MLTKILQFVEGIYSPRSKGFTIGFTIYHFFHASSKFPFHFHTSSVFFFLISSSFPCLLQRMSRLSVTAHPIHFALRQPLPVSPFPWIRAIMKMERKKMKHQRMSPTTRPSPFPRVSLLFQENAVVYSFLLCHNFLALSCIISSYYFSIFPILT